MIFPIYIFFLHLRVLFNNFLVKNAGFMNPKLQNIDKEVLFKNPYLL